MTKMNDKEKNLKERKGAFTFHFEGGKVGKSYGGSPQALSQSVGVTDPETSNSLRLPTVYPTSYLSEALYDQVVSSDLSQNCRHYRGAF